MGARGAGLLLLSSGPAGGVLELLAPARLGWLALLAPLVVLYVLKIKRERRKVASTWLWASARRDLLARSPFRRLVAQVPLVVQALGLLALAFALARPATRGRAFTGDHVALVLDVSASMSAASDPPDASGRRPTRLELARAAAKELLSSLAPGSDAMILEAGRDARLVAPLDRDLVRMKAAVDRVQVRDVEGDLGAAVALAVDRLRPLGGTRRIVVLTDGDLARPAGLAGAALPVEVVTVGTPVDNAAIVRVDVRSGTDTATGREEVQGFLVVANFGRAPRDLYVTMREENASDVLASRRVLVQPGERLPVQLTFLPTRGDYRKGLLFELSPHDAMPVDDTAYGRVPAGDKLPVYLAGASSPWLERALGADPMVDLHVVTVAALLGGAAEVDPAAATSKAGSAQLPGVGLDAFVVLEGACPADVPGGDLLLVAPPPGRCFGTVVGGPVEHPTVTSWDNGDPRLRFLTLDGVHIKKAALLRPDGASQQLIRSQEGVLATDISTAARTATLVGFEVGDSDWPLKASFVLFVRNLLEQARAHRAHGITGPARAGEPLRVTVPPTARDLTATGPGLPGEATSAPREALEVSLRGGLAVLPDLARVGFYDLAWQGPQAGSVVVPANLTSVAESDLGPKPLALEGGQVTVVASAAKLDAHSEWTWVLALAALGLVVLDVAWLTRSPRPRASLAVPSRGVGGRPHAPASNHALPRPRLPEGNRA